jgi:very-short-patch-repair endonuclease
MKKSRKEMYYGASDTTMDHARALRHKTTNAEDILWEELRNRKLGGFKFRRQHAIGRFIADFYCHEAGLVIELDGNIHEIPDKKEYDKGRTTEMQDNHLTVLRFYNEEILTNKPCVLLEILNTIKKLNLKHPLSV